MGYNIIHLSDISMADGRGMDQEFLSNKNYSIKRNSYQWPHKHRIIPSDYTVWRKFLRWIFSAGYSQLQQPLGAWMHKENWLTNWTWFVTSCNQFLYHKLSNELWHRHILKQNRHHTFQTHSLVLHEAPNEPLSRASVCHSTNSICILNSSTINFNIPPIQKDIHTYDAITIEWPDLDWFMDNITYNINH